MDGVGGVCRDLVRPPPPQVRMPLAHPLPPILCGLYPSRGVGCTLLLLMEQMKVPQSFGLQDPDCSPLLPLFPPPPGPSGAEAKANFRNPPDLSSKPLTHDDEN